MIIEALQKWKSTYPQYSLRLRNIIQYPQSMPTLSNFVTDFLHQVENGTDRNRVFDLCLIALGINSLNLLTKEYQQTTLSLLEVFDAQLKELLHQREYSFIQKQLSVLSSHNHNEAFEDGNYELLEP